jgi:DNA-binding response OmpR family regulator
MQLYSGPSRKVLVVEDEPAVLELVVTRLAIAGYTTFQARNGQEAIRRMAEVSPAAMVLDLNMPVVDGFDVLAQMHQNGQTKVIGVLVLTARNQPQDVRQAIALGARDFLTKPFKDEQLLARVARLFRRPNQQQGGVLL